MNKLTFKCKCCKQDNTFNPKECIPYDHSCVYSNSYDHGLQLTCSHCKSSSLYDSRLDFTSKAHHDALYNQYLSYNKMMKKREKEKARKNSLIYKVGTLVHILLDNLIARFTLIKITK